MTLAATPRAATTPRTGRATTRGWAFWWAVGGVAGALGDGVFRLGARAADDLRALEADQVPAWIAITGALAIVEGRVLARRFVPSVVARAATVAARGRVAAACAPLVAASLIDESTKVCARAWCGVAAIVAAVIVVRALPSPWRGMIDAGVALALAAGLLALGRMAIAPRTRPGTRRARPARARLAWCLERSACRGQPDS